MRVSAVVHSTDDSLREEAQVCGRWTIAADEPESLGGTDTAPTPYELLAASLATCVAITVRMYARRKEWPLEEFRVEVCLDREDRPHHCTVEVHLPPGLPAERQQRLQRVASRCPVQRTLEQGLVLEHIVPTASGDGSPA
jgi:putative redox protein